MSLKIYNTLTRKKEIFRPLKRGKVNMFVCGITSYDFSHLGHARTYLVFDMIAKYLKQGGYKVFYLQNITDIDDKIIDRAIKEKIFWKNLSKKFERKYLKDMEALNINSVTKYARATDHIKEMVSQVEQLLEKGFAYQIKDGIYYDIKKFKDYGKLSRRTILRAEDAVSRIDQAQGKRNKRDFCLWKYAKSLGSLPARSMRKGTCEYEPSWAAPFGRGRPGWHIEDTAITEKFLGTQYDIHGGARDLIFPHHEAEIAQMEALSGKKPMVRYWLHTGFLTVGGRKMAKSLGNFVTIKDFIEKHSARVLRFLVLKSHYRSPIDYNEGSVLQAERELEKIDEFIEKLRPVEVRLPQCLRESDFYKEFEKAMDPAFNTPKVMAAIFELINWGNSLMDQNLLTKTDAKNILEFFKKIDRFFNFIFWPKPKEKPPRAVLSLVRQREKYRGQKDWQKADQIRQEISRLDWWVEDTKEGPKLKKMK